MSVLPPPISSSLMLKRKREFTYVIFLSFNGKDTRKKFTGHLHSALTRQGIETFRDDKSLEKGEDFTPELVRAIGESWGSIIVISKTYAFSQWCLDELVEIMKQRKERRHRVYPIFYEVEPSDFRYQRNSVKEAFVKHDKRHDKKKTQQWRVALEKVTGIDGWVLKDQYESDFIEDIVKNISEKFDAEVLDEEEVEKLKSTFQTIQAWLVDAENERLMKQGERVKVWLDKLKHIAYDIDDVLDEWNISILRSKFEKDQARIPSVSSSSLGLPDLYLPAPELDSLNQVQLSFRGRGASSLGPPCLNLPTPEFAIALHHDIAVRIKELNKKFQDIVNQKDVFPFTVGLNNSCSDLRHERPETVSLIDESVVYGRDYDKNALIRMLVSENNPEERVIPIISIVGMGGIGKTTLAQIVYNHHELSSYFQKKIWVSVSDPFDEMRIAKAILVTLRGSVRDSSLNELNSVLEKVRRYIGRSRYLLVLDDVWNEDEGKWQSLKNSLNCGSQGSKILVTTSKENVATIMGCTKLFHLGRLSQEECWSIFSQIAFFGRTERERESLEDTGKKIACRCQGLPLAAKTLGGLLRFKKSREQWQTVLDSHMWELDEVEKGFFSPLLLSYYDLPSQLRQCFSYCAIFPKAQVIEKDMLIKLWMAQGFLGETQQNKEIVGEEYFDSLAAHSFFMEFKKDKNDDSIIIGCKMHDMVLDFARLLRKTECCLVAGNEIEERGVDFYHKDFRHLTLIRDNEHAGIPDPIYNVKKLRSLLVDSRFCTSSLEASLPKLFDQLTCLRMLNLSHCSIKELPREIGKLIHLRYLSLEANLELFALPEAICDLCNLQTLNIRNCFRLQKLPHGMEKLINLRHLQNGGVYKLLIPRGMQGLTSLRTLEVLSLKKKGGIESEKSFSLVDLGNLIHLRGHLEITGLRNMEEESQAREAQLSTKTGLCSLSLNFRGDERKTRIMDEALVLQALQPPQHLQKLKIEYYKGPTFSNWMTSLTSLKTVTLFYCYEWESLPPMWKLPSLESLSIIGLKQVKKVGEEFVGVETSSSSSVSHHIAFPSLKELTFSVMDRWEEWEYENVLSSRGGDGSSCSSSNITIMPKLQCLLILGCPGLKMLPRHLLQSTTLQELEIIFSHNL